MIIFASNTGLVWYHWVIIAVGILLLAGLIFSICLTMYIAREVYFHTLAKRHDDEWGRVCSAPDNEEQMAMWNEGLKWGEENKEYKKELSIVSHDGLKLFGEFFDFGHDKTVLVLSGRCECAWYGYYYALPYQKAGYNILVIDGRAHGLSDGRFSTVGIKESEDAVQWMELLKEKYGQKTFVLHCICIGGSTGILAAKTEFGKANVSKITIDGGYINFKESYKRHYIAKGHALFPVYYEIWIWFRHYTHCNASKSNPLKEIKNIKAPVLFIHSKKDIFSLPEKAQLLFDACPTEKVVKWFEEGKHSHVRFSNQKEYDQTIIDFVK